jgi:hypothetical protein
MNKKELLERITHAVNHIHNDVFHEFELCEVLNENDEYMNKALSKYAQYFNYSENPDKYNLKYCFHTTIDDLNEFYKYQENKIESVKDYDYVCEIEHKVNQHIYDEVILCQKKVNNYYYFNIISSYIIAFLLIFGMTEIMHMFEMNTLLSTTLLALFMAFVKIFIDKKYLEKVRNKIGWKNYKRAIVRSLAFYLNLQKSSFFKDIDNIVSGG